jgi:hypothetical protein
MYMQLTAFSRAAIGGGGTNGWGGGGVKRAGDFCKVKIVSFKIM